MGRSSGNRRSPRAAAAALDRNDDVLAAGQHAALGAAALLGMLAVGAPALERALAPRPATSERSLEVEATRPTVAPKETLPASAYAPISAAGVRPRSILVQSGAFSQPFGDVEARDARNDIHVEDAAPGLATMGDTPATPDQTLPIEADPLRLDLALNPAASRRAHGDRVRYASPLRSLRTSSTSSAWKTAAENLVSDWRPSQTRDLSVFVAADDEALSWSFSQASPNHSRVVYRDDRVEVGEHAAGVAMSINDMDLALAVVDKEQGSNLGYSVNERYLGVLWTYRR